MTPTLDQQVADPLDTPRLDLDFVRKGEELY